VSQTDGPGFSVHPKGLCESVDVGEGTTIWAFAHVLSGASIGRDVNLCDFTFVENDVILGDRVTVKCHVALWDGLRAEDDVFIGPGASFTNDRYPRSKRRGVLLQTILRRGASIGAGAVILPGLTIGEYALVGAGAVVVKDVPPFTLVKGNPAREAGLVCRCGAPLAPHDGGWRCTLGDWTGEAPNVSMRCAAC